MINPHPPLAAFPLALVVSTLLLEGYAAWRRQQVLWRKTLRFMLRGAALFTVLTFFSGYYASEVADAAFKVPDQPIALHHLIGKLALFGVPICAVLQHFAFETEKPGMQLAYRVALILATALVAFAGYLGGELVFSYGAAVTAR